jgi:hypothetical protein
MTNHNQTDERFSQELAALLNALVESDDVHWEIRHPIEDSQIEVSPNPNGRIAYAWNPAEPKSEVFFANLETEGLLNDLEPDVVNAQASEFFTTLDHLWQRSLYPTLVRKFATVPRTLLQTITQQALQLARTSQSLSEKLVQCSQAVLPDWNVDDLEVLARPMAYALRGESPSPTAHLLVQDWEQLSATEQAKVSLAIAQYALDYLAQH